MRPQQFPGQANPFGGPPQQAFGGPPQQQAFGAPQPPQQGAFGAPPPPPTQQAFGSQPQAPAQQGFGGAPPLQQAFGAGPPPPQQAFGGGAPPPPQQPAFGAQQPNIQQNGQYPMPPQQQQQQQVQQQLQQPQQQLQQQPPTNPFGNHAPQQQQTNPFPGAPPPGAQQGAFPGAAPPPPGQPNNMMQQQQLQPQQGPGGMNQMQPGMQGGMQLPPPGPGGPGGMMTGSLGPGINPIGGAGSEALHAELHARAQELNCGSQFVRTTMTRIPQSLMTKQKLGIPVGCLIQPLSERWQNVSGGKPCEYVSPVIDQQTGRGTAPLGSVIRCKKCRAYINPYVIWLHNGRQWKCNMCQFQNECLNMYYAPIDEQTGKRIDIQERPELQYGGVEFLATGEYLNKPPQPPVFTFLIDVTQRSINSGFVTEACAGAKEAILKMTDPNSPSYELNQRTLVGILTFDSSIHFYNLNNGSDIGSPQMIVVSDLEDLFLPVPDDTLLNVQDYKDSLCGLLDNIPNLFRETRINESCFGIAIKAAFLVMRHVGGKVSAFTCTCPTLGQDGRCNPNRETQTLQGISNGSAAVAQGQDKDYDAKEAELFRALHEDYKELAGKKKLLFGVSLYEDYKELTSKIMMVQMTVDLYMAPANHYFDVATVKLISHYTGGDTYYYDNFTPQQQGRKLREEIIHAHNRSIAWEAIMRVRVSMGWIVKHFFGHMLIRGQDLLTIPNCHNDYTMGITVDMEDGVSVVDHQINFQVALLYTAQTGERRIRVLTYVVVATQNYAELLHSVDPQVSATVFSMLATDRGLRGGLSDARAYLTSTIHQIVSHNCSIQDQGNFQYLPLYVFGLLKSPLIRPGQDLTADRRMAAWARQANLTVDKAASLFVPRLMPLHEMRDEEGVLDQNGTILLPEKLNLSANSLTPKGCYLIENGQQIICFVGQEIDPNFLEQLFGVRTVQELPIDGQVTEDEILAPSGTAIKDKFLNIIDAIRKEIDLPYMALSLTCQGRLDNAERRFWEMLIEDKGSGLNLSYDEFEARMKQGSMGPGMIR